MRRATHLSAQLLAACLAALPGMAAAQAPAAPGAGTLLQQVQPPMPPGSTTPPRLQVQPPPGAASPQSAPFLVRALRITGNTAFETSRLHALVAQGEGASLTLAQVAELAMRITAFYREQGFPLARAIIPAQVIRDGVVTIEVVEARYGQVALDNRSRVRDELLRATLEPLRTGETIAQTPLDRTLLLLSDIPGVVIQSTLRPGKTVGSSDLDVVTLPGRDFTGHAVIDNHGNRYTGRVRAGAAVNFVNPLRHGDVLGLSGLTSGSGMNYVRGTYEALLNGAGTRGGASLAALRYELGEEFAALDADGTAAVASVWVKHPFWRRRDVNAYAQLQYDRKQFEDRVGSSGVRNSRHLDNVSLNFAGDARGVPVDGGISSWNVALTLGHVTFDDAAAEAADAATARTRGNFVKWTANLAHLQSLGGPAALYLAFAGQWANRNLDSAERLSAGGASTVRGYDVGALAGDTGWLATAEFRYDVGALWEGRWQLVAFIDSARLTLNHSPWAAGINDARLHSAGLGVNWEGDDGWRARIYAARRIGSVPAVIGASRSGRVWAEISKAF